MNSAEELALLVPNNGDTTRVICPSCDGGSSREKSLGITNLNGQVRWHCFRSSCGYGGGRFIGGTIAPDATELREILRPYQGTMMPLSEDKVRYFKTTYGVDARAAGIKSNGDGRYLLPINTYYGDLMGWISRRPWGEPQTADGAPKSLTYWHEQGPLLAWSARPRYLQERAQAVLAVEDQLSAIRAHQLLGATTVALLGTGVNQEKIAAIQKHTDNLVIALDKDATGQAFNIARKWGQAFKSCRVLILENDIKDMHTSDLHELVI